MKTLLTAATVAIASFGTMGSAATIALDSAVPTIAVAPGSPAGQDFVPELLAAGVTHLYSGPISLIAANRPSRVTFDLVGAESGFNDSLSLNGDKIIAENQNGSAADFLTDTLVGGLGLDSFTFDWMGGDLASLLSFSNGPQTFTSADDEFGVFANSADIANLSVFFLGFDDSGANNDDNHDDILVRVEISAVPVPASGLLLLGGLGGLAAMRRRKKA